MPSTGSFGGGSQQIEAALRAKKAADAAKEPETAKPAAADAGAEKPAEIKDRKEERIVPSARFRRTMPAAEFRKHYAEVYEQVRAKDHLLASQVELSAHVGGCAVRLRSLRRRDDQFLATWTPTPIDVAASMVPASAAPDARKTYADYVEATMAYTTLQIAAQLVRYGDIAFDGPRPSDCQDPGAWMNHPRTVQARSFLEGLDEVLFDALVALSNDFRAARQEALLESLANP